MAAIGYLMYGSDLLDEVTTNMIKTEGYSKAVKVVILILVAIIPLTKFPLQSVYRPDGRSEHSTQGTDINLQRCSDRVYNGSLFSS